MRKVLIHSYTWPGAGHNASKLHDIHTCPFPNHPDRNACVVVVAPWESTLQWSAPDFRETDPQPTPSLREVLRPLKDRIRQPTPHARTHLSHPCSSPLLSWPAVGVQVEVRTRLVTLHDLEEAHVRVPHRDLTISCNNVHVKQTVGYLHSDTQGETVHTSSAQG